MCYRYCPISTMTSIIAPLLVFMIMVISNSTANAAPSASSSQSSAESTKRQPNFVVIFADDLGYGDIGAFGSTTINTPNIDRMATEGAKFDQFYAASPVCTPSRAALLTGRYPIRQGIHKVFYPESLQGMDPEEITISEMLKTVGYTTGLVGKWHLGHHDQYMPWNQGFDEFFGVPYSNDMGGLYYFRNKEIQFEEIDQRYMTRTYTEEAIKFIDKHQDEPFFLYLAHNMPHVPIYASPEFTGKSAGGLYGDVVEEMDWGVGQIIKRLDELGLSKDTLVIFTSDNGPWLLMGDEGGSAGSLRAGKQYTFEGGMRVPTVALWPGHIAEGLRPEGFATMMDWLPTFATLSGAAVPDDREIDGRDISGILSGEGSRENQELFYYMDGELRAYRSGDWKIKLPYKGKRGYFAFLNKGFMPSHNLLLFNLKQDPEEQNNLASHESERVASMLAEIESFQASLGDLPPAKKTGKNMDFSPYISLITILVVKIVSLLALLVATCWLLYRQIQKRLGSVKK